MNLRKNCPYDLLNEYLWLCKEEEDEDENELDYVERFDTNMPLFDYDRADMIDGILEFNEKLKAFAMEYAVSVVDLLRLKKVYEPFLEKLHSQSRYLDNSETAKVVDEFIAGTKSRTETFEKLQPSGNMRLHILFWNKRKAPYCAKLITSTQ